MKIARSTALVLIGSALLAQFADWEGTDWHRAFPPFKIAGNLYYVGTADLAVYLIATPQGNILINSDFPEDVPLIRTSIEQLGLRYADTRVLLISHAHSDHDGATEIIKQNTGARLMVMDADVQEEESATPGRPGAHVDRALHDRDTVELGGSTLTAYLTPGHTKGCTTWTMDVSDGGRRLHAVIIGSPNVNSGYVLVGNQAYPQIADDYVKTFAVLKGLPADLYLGAHGGYFGLKAKYEHLKSARANPFIDPSGYQAFVRDREAAFLREWNRQKQRPAWPTEAVMVFGGTIVALSAFITAAIDYSTRWRRVFGVLTVLVFVCLAAMGAIMGIIIREAVKAIR